MAAQVRQGNDVVVRAGNNIPWHASAHIPCWIGTGENAWPRLAQHIPVLNAAEMHDVFRELAKPRQLDYCAGNFVALMMPGKGLTDSIEQSYEVEHSIAWNPDIAMMSSHGFTLPPSITWPRLNMHEVLLQQKQEVAEHAFRD